jgi:prevent-host-death family protein
MTASIATIMFAIYSLFAMPLVEIRYRMRRTWCSLSARLDLVHDLAILEPMEVNIHEAKTHLSKLLARVLSGEEVVIAKAGVPVAKLVPVKKVPIKRTFGSAKGEFTVPDDFNDPDPEIENLFYNGPLFPK